MKAWRIEKHGGPEALELKEIPKPKADSSQALIKVESVGLNHLDLWARNGVSGYQFPLPLTPGCDVSGTIEEFGTISKDQMKNLEKEGLVRGSPVLVNPGLSCGRCEACLGGFDPLCKNYGILGETRDGGLAEYVSVPIINLISRPKTLTAQDAASLPIPFLTAWTMITRKAQLRPGETILIQAGGSGVSIAAIQISKLFGATVVTTVGSDDKLEKALKLGADHAINYKKMSFVDETKKYLSKFGKKTCDVVLDHVGADTFEENMKCLSWGGRFVTCGATSGGQVNLDLKSVFFKNISILGSTMGSKSDLLRIVELVSNHKLKPVIDSTFPMSKAPEAFAKLESRKFFGKIILNAD